MDDNQKRAIEAIRQIAERKVASYAPAIKKKAELTLKDIGVEPETAAMGLGAAKLLHDLGQGRFEYNGDGLGVEATMRPEEKKLMLKYNKKF